jgi:hypothetical protein
MVVHSRCDGGYTKTAKANNAGNQGPSSSGKFNVEKYGMVVIPSSTSCNLRTYINIIISLLSHTFFFLLQTERAAERIKLILGGDTAAGALGIRLGVKRRKS